MNDEMRLHSFKTCQDSDDNVIGIQFFMAVNPYTEVDVDLYEMAPIGLMEGICHTVKPSGPLHQIRAAGGDDGVTGIKYYNGDEKQYGDVPKRRWKKTDWEFSEDQPLVGLYGRQSERGIEQIGFITLDTQCQLAAEIVVEEEETAEETTVPVVEPDTTVEEVVEPEKEIEETVVEEENAQEEEPVTETPEDSEPVVEEEIIEEEAAIEVEEETATDPVVVPEEAAEEPKPAEETAVEIDTLAPEEHEELDVVKVEFIEKENESKGGAGTTIAVIVVAIIVFAVLLYVSIRVFNQKKQQNDIIMTTGAPVKTPVKNASEKKTVKTLVAETDIENTPNVKVNPFGDNEKTATGTKLMGDDFSRKEADLGL